MGFRRPGKTFQPHHRCEHREFEGFDGHGLNSCPHMIGDTGALVKCILGSLLQTLVAVGSLQSRRRLTMTTFPDRLDVVAVLRARPERGGEVRDVAPAWTQFAA
jgi:hypothetical protein